MAAESRHPSVLVAGSQADPSAQSQEFEAFCAELGREVAREHFTLVAGSIRQRTADRHVLRGAGERQGHDGLDVPPAVRFIRPVDGGDEVPFETELEALGRFAVRHELYPGRWEDVRRLQVEAADVVILVGGSKGTASVEEEADRQKKPVIAIARFGGTAQAARERLTDSRLLDTWGAAIGNPARYPTTPKDIVDLIRRWWTGERSTMPEGGDESTADVGIICPLEEELQAVLRRIPINQWRLARPDPAYVQTFYTARLGDLRLAIASPTSMGRVHAAVTTVDLIRRYSPRYLILVGIAGGNQAEGVALGDVIVSNQIIDYEVQKLRRGGPEIRPQSYVVHQRMLGEAQALADWESAIEVERPDGDPGRVSRRVGPTLCGDKVIAVSRFMKDLKRRFPKVVGVEMEGAGCALACLRFDPSPGFFMVRGVSDLADEKKQAGDVLPWRPYACDAAAAFALRLLLRLPIASRRPI